MKHLALALVALGCSSQAMAAKWVVVDRGDKFIASVDADSIKRDDKGRWTFWFKNILKEGETGILRYRLDCENMTLLDMGGVIYNAKGDVSQNVPSKYTEASIIPDSVGSAVSDIMCRAQ